MSERSVNKVMLVGRVGNDPEIRTTGSSKRVAKFSLATSSGKAGSEKTQWHRCTAWEQLADIVEKYVHKGDRLWIEGAIEYSDKDGKYYTDIIVRDLVMLGGKEAREPVAAKTPSDPFAPDDDDLPF